MLLTPHLLAGKAKVWLAAQDDEAADPETLRREAAEVDQLALAVKRCGAHGFGAAHRIR